MIKTITPLKTGPFQINTWIVPLADNAVFITDPAACKTTGDEGAVINFLKQNELRPVGIILTHCHFDHITGLRIIKDAYPDCRIAVHKADAEACGTAAAEKQRRSLEIMGLQYIIEALEDLPPADVLLQDSDTLDNVFMKESEPEIKKALSQWKVIHTPGHSPGSICLFNAQQEKLISGDTIFYQAFGRTDLEGGSQSQLIKSLSHLKENIPPETLIFPGHDYYGFPLYDTL